LNRAFFQPRPLAKATRGNNAANKRATINGSGRTIPDCDIDAFALRIRTAWNKQIEGIIETGTLLIEAKTKLQHGQFGKMIEEKKLPFGWDAANKLMKIARHPVLSNSEHVMNLPPCWGTLYALCELPDDVLEEMIADGKLHCEIERKEVKEICEKVKNEGHYVWAELRESLNQLVRFMEKWPDPNETVRHVMEECNDAVDCSKLSALATWTAELHSGCEREEASIDNDAFDDDKVGDQFDTKR
jgi:hypothetical protein